MSLVLCEIKLKSNHINTFYLSFNTIHTPTVYNIQKSKVPLLPNISSSLISSKAIYNIHIKLGRMRVFGGRFRLFLLCDEKLDHWQRQRFSNFSFGVTLDLVVSFPMNRTNGRKNWKRSWKPSGNIRGYPFDVEDRMRIRPKPTINNGSSALKYLSRQPLIHSLYTCRCIILHCSYIIALIFV